MPTEDVSPTTTTMMLELLTARFGKAVRPHESLSRHGTFAVGGPADAWITITAEEELLDLVSLARDYSWPLLLIGNGTNVLYADAGARGIVARIALDFWHLQPATDGEHELLVAAAGDNLPKLVNQLAARGLSGLEWGAGVPGTIGGAVVSNAGAQGACVADTIQRARVLFASPENRTAPEVRDLPAADLALRYRHSRFRRSRRVAFDDTDRPLAAPRAAIEPAEIVLDATFLLTRDDPPRIRERIRAYLQHRKDTQPPQASAGSVFTNPPGDYAGRLIEACGLKGTRIGKAEISPRHANFIVNTGGATAADVVGLIALARRTVRARFGVELELEVELRGDW